MIIFKKIRCKNLFAVGNHPIEIDLNKSQTTLVTGTNGSGKSSVIIETIIFALYGKPFRKINKGQIVNSINKKDLLTEIWFSKGSDDFYVKRGIRPNLFEIWKNDVLIDQTAAVRDYQDLLEEEILQMNYRAFTQIVVIGMASFVPFMELPAAQRREFVEELLDYGVFSTMNQLLKEEMSENKAALKETDRDIESNKRLRESVIRHNEQMLQLKTKNEESIKSEIEAAMSVIDKAEKEIIFHNKVINDLQPKIALKQQIRKKIDERRDLVRAFTADISDHQKNHDFFSKNDICPTCQQNIEEKLRRAKILTEEEQITNKVEAIEKLTDMLAKLDNQFIEIKKLEKDISSAETSIIICKRDIESSYKIVKQKKEELRQQIVFKNDELSQVDSKIKFLSGIMDQLSSKQKIQSIAHNVLKDNGVKSFLIKRYVQTVNDLINSYLYSFGLFVDFNLDENFNETIKSRYRDEFSFANFSEGEKMRINFAIMFAWRNLSQLRNSMSTNLLVLDETLDGVVDDDGIGEIIRTLKTLNEKDNIFVISHRSNTLSSVFDRNIHFVKEDGFTILQEEE